MHGAQTARVDPFCNHGGTFVAANRAYSSKLNYFEVKVKSLPEKPKSQPTKTKDTDDLLQQAIPMQLAIGVVAAGMQDPPFYCVSHK
jgi:hypothetical protein